MVIFIFKIVIFFLVRMISNNAIECTASLASGDSANDPDEMAYNLSIQRWQKQLDIIFG